MSEPEPGADGRADRNRGSLTAFLTSGPALIGAFAALITAITGLIIGLNQIGVIGGNNGETTNATTTAEDDTTTTGAAAYFKAGTRPRGRVYFEGETMLVTATTPNLPLEWEAEIGEPLRDVYMSVRARRVSGAPSYGVGLICRKNDKNYYLLSVFSGGGYNIVKYTGGKPRSLRRGSGGGSKDDEEDDVEARCVGSNPTTLTLVVDGEEVDTVDDPEGIEGGSVGIRVGTDEARVTVGFDEFVLRSL